MRFKKKINSQCTYDGTRNICLDLNSKLVQLIKLVNRWIKLNYNFIKLPQNVISGGENGVVVSPLQNPPSCLYFTITYQAALTKEQAFSFSLSLSFPSFFTEKHHLRKQNSVDFRILEVGLENLLCFIETEALWWLQSWQWYIIHKSVSGVCFFLCEKLRGLYSRRQNVVCFWMKFWNFDIPPRCTHFNGCDMDVGSIVCIFLSWHFLISTSWPKRCLHWFNHQNQ